MKAYGFIHTHSEYSLKDAPLKLADIVKEAKKMGATAIALTDHGTAAGWIEFYDLCKNEGIKPILGVEAYIRSETNSRTHLILLAKNYTGYKEISQAISDSNENIERIADMDIPIMTKEILQKYLHVKGADATNPYGHVKEGKVSVVEFYAKGDPLNSASLASPIGKSSWLGKKVKKIINMGRYPGL